MRHVSSCVQWDPVLCDMFSFSNSLKRGVTDGRENLRPDSKAHLSGGITAPCRAGGQLESISTDILICVF